MNGKNIEVEVRAIIGREKYEELLKFFSKNAKPLKDDYQETYYFDLDSNLRIQRNSGSSKLWHKSGNVHDEMMEEIEIEAKRGDFEKLEKFLNKLGHAVKVKWFRKRKQFYWGGIVVSLDYTRGYAHIIEMEMVSDEKSGERNLELLKRRFRELKIPITPKEEFKKRYDNYVKNWRELVEYAMD
jgi:predicted adenylyl cyclase CyaB